MSHEIEKPPGLEIIERGEAAMAAYMQDQLNIFRARVLGQVAAQDLDPYPYHMSWEYWTLGETQTDEHDEPRYTDIGMIVLIDDKNKHKPDTEPEWNPYVRFIKSEWFSMPYGNEYLTRDICIDGDGDASQIVDSFMQLPGDNDPDESDGNLMERKAMTMKSNTPLFTSQGNGILSLRNYQPFPVMRNFNPEGHKYLQGSKEAEKGVYPWGIYRDFIDHNAAMSEAIAIWDIVENLPPDSKGRFDIRRLGPRMG